MNLNLDNNRDHNWWPRVASKYAQVPPDPINVITLNNEK